MTTFAALGDSITLGVGDPAPDGGWRGWAAFLAQGLPGGRLVNLAGNGAKAGAAPLYRPRALPAFHGRAAEVACLAAAI